VFTFWAGRSGFLRAIALVLAVFGLGTAVYALQTVPLVVWRLDTDAWKIETASPTALPNDKDRDSMVSVNGTIVTLGLASDGITLKAFRNGNQLWARQIASTATSAEKSNCESVFGVLRSTNSDGILVQTGLCDKIVSTLGVSSTSGKTLWSNNDVDYDVIAPANRIAPVPSGYVVTKTAGSKTTFAVLDGDSGTIRKSADFTAPGTLWSIRSDGRYVVASFPAEGKAVLVDFNQTNPTATTISVEPSSIVDVFDGTAYFAKNFEDRYEISAIELNTKNTLWKQPVYKMGLQLGPSNITATSFGPMVLLANGDIFVHNPRSGLLRSGVKEREATTFDSLSFPFTTRAGGAISDTFVSRGFSAKLGRDLLHDTATDSVVYLEKDVPRWRLFLKRPPNKVLSAGANN
jgi:hypothetical protein